MTQKLNEELIKCAAEEVMRGGLYDTKHGWTWKFHGIQGILEKDWNPLENPYHTNMLIDAVKKMGFEILRVDDDEHFYVEVNNVKGEHQRMKEEDMIVVSKAIDEEGFEKEINKTIVETIIQAVRELKGK